jgi:hypothetical protein
MVASHSTKDSCNSSYAFDGGKICLGIYTAGITTIMLSLAITCLYYRIGFVNE